MRKIGSLSTAFGFIFLGIVWILYQHDRVLAYNILKFWPLIFVFVGLEFLIESIKGKRVKPKFNYTYIVVIVILVFSSLIMQITVTNFNGININEYIN